MIHLKKHILTLVALIALTTQAWAEDPSESFTTTGDQVEFTGEHFIITGTENFEGLGFNVDNGRTITIASMNNEIITRVMLTFYDGYKYFGHGTADHGTIEYTYQDSREGVASIKDVNSTTLTIGCEISGFYCFTQICQITVYYTTAPAVTFVPVSGKTNEWTIKDGMPAGNVIVNAEYYQDAAFAMSSDATPVALAPTANNSAKANTDDPLVTGGEVANIVEGTEALEAKQGTLMYYFDKNKATTQMTAAQLEALTAEEWSDKVPTADGLHFDAATDVFVYYYIKGADDVTGLADGVKHTFSDSDPVCLTVSVQKEPTFKVELNAEGLTTEEAANWKAAKGTDDPAAFPLTGVKKDDNVTVTYSGSRKVIGLKAEKKGPTVVDLSTLSENIYQVTEDVILTGTPASDFLIVSKNEYVVTLDNVNPEGSKDVYISGLGKPVYIKLKGTSRLIKIYSYEVPIEGNVSIDEAESGGTLILSSYGSPLASLSSVIINGGTVKARCTNTNGGNAIWTDLIVNGGAVYLEGGGSENAVSDTITAGSGVTLYGWNGSAWDSTNTSSKYVTTDNTSGDPTAWTW